MTSHTLGRDPLCVCGTRMVAVPVDGGAAGMGAGYVCPLHVVAPDLLAACKALENAQTALGFEKQSAATIEALVMVRSAIAKAEGRP